MNSKTQYSIMIFCITVAFFAIVASCATSSNSPRNDQPPLWMTDKDSAYPPEQFLAEIGEGNSYRDAKANAAGAIAQTFRTRIVLENTIRTQYTESTQTLNGTLDLAAQTDFEQTIGQSADESLLNLKYGESWQDEMGRVYTIAYLDRMETGTIYRQRIMLNNERVVELIRRAEEQEDALRRYAFLDAALAMAEASAGLLEQLSIINIPIAQSILLTYDRGNIQAMHADQVANLTFQIEVSGDNSGLIQNILSEWVTQKGFAVSNNAYMLLTAVVIMNPVSLDNAYENLQWELSLNLLDGRGYPAVSLNKQGRSSGISKSAARARVYQEITQIIQKEFDGSMTTYLQSFLEK